MRPDQKWKMGGGATVFVLVAILLARDLAEPGNTGWNILLGLMIVGILIAAFFLQRFFREHIDEIGEARFDTRNPDEKK
jgi:leucyl aminopeptidase